MRFPEGTKLEKVASKDKSRPVLTHAFLRIEEGDSGRKGWLEATDSYKLARIPVEVEADDKEGFVPVSALKAAREAKTFEVAVNGDVVAEVEGGQLTLTQPKTGTFPDVPSILPKEKIAFEVGINATFLKDLTDAIGAQENVRLSFVADDDGKPNPLKPIQVGILGNDAIGLLMPVRLA